MDMTTMNPIDLSARARILLLAASNADSAKELLSALDFSINEESVQENLAPSMYAEYVLYASTISYIEKIGCKNVLELSCGYSPLGLKLAKEGYNYVGADHLEIAEAMAFATKPMNRKNCKYIAIDYDNEASLYAAADMLDGPIAIVTQGLSSAMTMDEKLLALEGIGKVLGAHGGVWIIPDLESRKLTQGFQKIISGKETEIKKTKLDLDSLGWLDAEESISALKALKFNIEAVPLCLPELTNHLVELSDKDKRTNVEALLNSVTLGYVKAGEAPKPDNDLDIFIDLKETRLFVTLEGILTSDTANDLLSEYKIAEAEGGFTDITVDFRRLRYISSAGLRVLLIMKKAIGDGVLKIKNANDVVKEVFENTGFAELMELE